MKGGGLLYNGQLNVLKDARMTIKSHRWPLLNVEAERIAKGIL